LYKDNLGNVRLSYERSSEDGSAGEVSRNNYYPFGLNHINISGKTSHTVYNPSVSYENWKYNGKELEETGMYDYGARFYMPDIGRFGMYDPLAEKTFEPYAYVYNNPIKMIDPTGMEGEEASSDSGGGGGETGAGGGGMDSSPFNKTAKDLAPGPGMIDIGSKFKKVLLLLIVMTFLIVTNQVIKRKRA
jgi:RHS repeat-associated protein